MTAAFPTSIKNFGAARVDGDYIPASDMNTVREEIVAVETALILPANVNVLGNRSAAQEYVQRGVNTITGAGTPTTPAYFHDKAVTFAVAFSSTPIVVLDEYTAGYPIGALSTTTSGFTARTWNDSSGAISVNIAWLALGG
jgi:hypothetical protein